MTVPSEWSLRTARLVMRRFAARDLDRFHAYRNDPRIARWQGWSLPYAEVSAEMLVAEMSGVDLSAARFRPGEWTQLAVERLDSPGLIGDFGVRVEPTEPTAELGVTFSHAAQGQGYATEAMAAFVGHLLADRGFERVIAITHEENAPTRRLLDRVGFTQVARDGDELVYVHR